MLWVTDGARVQLEATAQSALSKVDLKELEEFKA